MPAQPPAPGTYDGPGWTWGSPQSRWALGRDIWVRRDRNVGTGDRPAPRWHQGASHVPCGHQAGLEWRGDHRSRAVPGMGSAPTCSPLSPGMPGVPGSPGSPTQSGSGLSPWGERGHVRSWGWLCIQLSSAKPRQAPHKASSAPQSPGGTVAGPAAVGTIPAAPWGPGCGSGVTAQPLGSTVHSPEPPPLSETAQSTGRKPGSHLGVPSSGAQSPKSCTPQVLSTHCSSPGQACHPAWGHIRTGGSCAWEPACPERAQPCKCLQLCTTVTQADAQGHLHPKIPTRTRGLRVTGVPPRDGQILTRAQFSLPGTPGMAPSPSSPLTLLGAAKAACSWGQSPQRVWEDTGSQGDPKVLGAPLGTTHGGKAPCPMLSPSAPRCSSQP